MQQNNDLAWISITEESQMSKGPEMKTSFIFFNLKGNQFTK